MSSFCASHPNGFHVLFSVCVWGGGGGGGGVYMILLLFSTSDMEEGNDWLFIVIADIITAHNDMVDLPERMVTKPFLRLLPNEQAKAYPHEMTTTNCIVPQFKKYNSYC